jgi:hypothetical protein
MVLGIGGAVMLLGLGGLMKDWIASRRTARRGPKEPWEM